MRQARDGRADKFKLFIVFSIVFCLLMVVLSIRALVCGLRAPNHATDKAPVMESGAGNAEPATTVLVAPFPTQELAPSPKPSGPANHAPDLETIRQMEQNATHLYQHLRQYSRENPEAEDALSEEEIKALEKAGAIAI